MLMEQEEIPDTREEVGGHHSRSNTRAAEREREREEADLGSAYYWQVINSTGDAYNIVQAGVEDINIDLEP